MGQWINYNSNTVLALKKYIPAFRTAAKVILNLLDFFSA